MEILNTYTYTYFHPATFLIIVFIIIVTLIMATVIDNVSDLHGWQVVLVGVTLAVSASILTIVFVIPKFTTEATRHQVTIDETVSFVDFSEKYIIISQEGKIYTIEERPIED